MAKQPILWNVDRLTQFCKMGKTGESKIQEIRESLEGNNLKYFEKALSVVQKRVSATISLNKHLV